MLLGYTLIPATQKPSGVVDDQDWSNSCFELASRWQTVATDGDTGGRQMRPSDHQTGRAYSKRGNNEVYELQNRLSGADHQPEKDQPGIEDHTIYSDQ